MRTVGLKTLKNKLSEYVRAAAAGETVLVTDRNRVVAELSPPRTAATSETPSEGYEELVRAGLIRRATRRGAGPPPRTPIMSFEALMEELSEDRADR